MVLYLHYVAFVVLLFCPGHEPSNEHLQYLCHSLLVKSPQYCMKNCIIFTFTSNVHLQYLCHSLLVKSPQYYMKNCIIFTCSFPCYARSLLYILCTHAYGAHRKFLQRPINLSYLTYISELCIECTSGSIPRSSDTQNNLAISLLHGTQLSPSSSLLYISMSILPP